MGEKDKSGPISGGYRLRDAFDEMKKDNWKFVPFHDYGHTLVDSKGKDHKTDFYEMLARWLAGEKN